jgi:dTDP-4-amino-4,6-dideoxygalactose transaminase
MSSSQIPVFDPLVQFRELKEELIEAAERVLSSGVYVMGDEVTAFEAEVAAYLGVDHAIGVNSGTDALTIALRTAGVQPGSEVITTAFTFFATAEAICQLGAIPVFADVESTLNIDPDSIENVLTSRTAAIIPVHLFGRPAQMTEILEISNRYGIPIIEDVAQAFGAQHDGRKAGTIGLAGAFSFFPSKNLSGFGDGGLIATNDREVAETARMLRVHGARRKYLNERIGYNSRLDALQAGLLRVKLPHIDRWNQQRVEAATVYDELLRDVPDITLPRPSSGDVVHQYTIRIADNRRDAVAAELKDASISTAIYYPRPLHQLPALGDFSQQPLPKSELAAQEVLSLPMWPGIEPEVQERVASAIATASALDS